MKEQVVWTAAALVLCAALPAKAGAPPNRDTAIEGGPGRGPWNASRTQRICCRNQHALIIDQPARTTGAVSRRALGRDRRSLSRIRRRQNQGGRIVVALDPTPATTSRLGAT
jgi:hypothetical protein